MRAATPLRWDCLGRHRRPRVDLMSIRRYARHRANVGEDQRERHVRRQRTPEPAHGVTPILPRSFIDRLVPGLDRSAGSRRTHALEAAQPGQLIVSSRYRPTYCRIRTPPASQINVRIMLGQDLVGVLGTTAYGVLIAELPRHSNPRQSDPARYPGSRLHSRSRARRRRHRVPHRRIPAMGVLARQWMDEAKASRKLGT